jgi:hypothetical protein
MARSTMHFIALVDSQVGSLMGELDDSVSFLCAQLAVSGTPKVFTQESGSPCHRMLTLTLMKSLTFFLVVPSGIRLITLTYEEQV